MESSRSAPSSIVASSSCSSPGDQATSSWRKLDTAALTDASGVRRSWLTAASRAVRTRFASPSTSACAAWVRRRSRSRAAAACAARPSSTRGLTPATSPYSSRRRSSRTLSTRAGSSSPAKGARLVTGTQRPFTSSTSCADICRVASTWSSTAVGVSAPPRTARASPSSACASAELRAASAARRAARCTTLLTLIAAQTNSSRASRFCGASMLRVCNGSVKYQLSSKLAAIADSTAGQKPPTAETATTSNR